MNTFPVSRLARSTYPVSELRAGPRTTKYWQAVDLYRDARLPRVETFTNSAWSARPKYPPPPRAGNAFAAAVLAAIPGLLLLMALLWVLDSIRHVLAT